jgi:hypothetical protein
MIVVALHVQVSLLGISGFSESQGNKCVLACLVEIIPYSDVV